MKTFSVEKIHIFRNVIQFPTFLVFYSSQDSLCKCLKISMQVYGFLFFQFSIASNASKETLISLHTPLYFFLLGPCSPFYSVVFPFLSFAFFETSWVDCLDLFGYLFIIKNFSLFMSHHMWPHSYPRALILIWPYSKMSWTLLRANCQLQH